MIFSSEIYGAPRLSDSFDTISTVQGGNMTGCIGIMHNANSMSIGSTPPSLMLNGNCITSITSSSTATVQRYRLDTLPTVATGCSLVATHDGIITSSAVSPASFAEASTTAVDANRGFSKTLAGLAAIGGKSN